MAIKEAAVFTPEKEPWPPKINPMRPKRTEKIPSPIKDWIAEFSLDGLRTLVYLNNETYQVKIESHTGRRITEYFPEFIDGFSTLAQKHSLILDGEIVFMEGKKGSGEIAKGRSQKMPPLIDPRYYPTKCHFFVFDLLYLDGQSLLDKPLSERKRHLSRLLSKKFQDEHGIARAPHWRNNHQVVLETAKGLGFEGIVLKRRESHYQQRTSRDWLKISFNG